MCNDMRHCRIKSAAIQVLVRIFRSQSATRSRLASQIVGSYLYLKWRFVALFLKGGDLLGTFYMDPDSSRFC